MVSSFSYGQSKGQVIDEIIAKVDNYIILKSDLEDTYRDYLQQYEMSENDARCQALQDLILNKVMVAKAEIDSIEVTEEEVESELTRRIQYMTAQFGSEERIEEYFDKTIDQFRQELRQPLKEQLQAQKMRAEITNAVKVTPAEVRRFFNQIPKDSLPYFSKEVTVGQIVKIPTIGRSQKEKAKQRALDIRNLIVKGEDISGHYRNYSLQLNDDFTLVLNAPGESFQGVWQLNNPFVTLTIEGGNENINRLNGEWLASVQGGSELKLVSSDYDDNTSFTLAAENNNTLLNISKSQLTRTWKVTSANAGGAPFGEMAKAHSEDPGSGSRGGALGFQKRGNLVPAYEATAMNLKPGEISQPVESQFGYHIIQLLERRGNEYNSRHILVKFNSSELDVEAAENYLDSLRTVIMNDNISFEKAAKEYSEDNTTAASGGFFSDPTTGTNSVSVEDLDPVVYFAIDTMEVGDISPPVTFRTDDGKEAVRLLYYKSSVPPHMADLNKDYSKIQMAALNQKRQKALFDWFEDAKRDVYIDIDEQYDACNIMETYSPLSNASNP